MTAGTASRRSRGGGGLDWLREEGGGDAAAVVRDLHALVGPPAEGERVQQVPCAHIDRSPYQARRVFPAASMGELRDSVRRNGLLQPVVVRPRPGGRYELIAGERRWRVVKLLGWENVPVVVRQVDDLTAHLLGQIENDAREDVSAWERALGYVDLRAHVEREEECMPSLTELGELRGGVDKSTVSRYLTIGEAFPPEIVARAGVPEEDMASLSLGTLLRAARKPEAQRFALLRDVLRKRRTRAGGVPVRAGREARTGVEQTDIVPAAADSVPEFTDSRPTVPNSGDDASESADRWHLYYSERGIRVETMIPAREMTAKQARAAGVRMVPALAALSARASDADHPTALALDGDGGTLIFLPTSLDSAQAAACESLRALLGI